ACIAPLLLLRTDHSQELALKWFLESQAHAEKFRESPETFWIVLGTALIGRPLSIIVMAIRHPLSSLRAIPQNWSRIVFATDIQTPLELVPTTGSLPVELQEVVDRFQFPGYVRWVRTVTPGWERWTMRPLLILIGSIAFVPALVYRFSVKSTALVYLPVLWVLNDSLVDSATFRHKLEDITNCPLERLKRWYSSFVIIVFFLMPAVIYLTLNGWWKHLSNWLQHAHPSAQMLLSAFLPAAPSGLHVEMWHVARGVNAVLTLLLFQWTYAKLRGIERGTLLKPERSVEALNVWMLIRGLLTLYIIGCTLYIIIAALNWRGVWPFQIRWFPWK